MSWILTFDDEGVVYGQTEATAREFKSSGLSCRAAERILFVWDSRRPSFMRFQVVHKTKEREFCEH